MSFFSRLFGRQQSATERELHDMYVRMLCTVAGYSPGDAQQGVSEAIAMCKQRGITEGTADLPEDFGDLIIEAARMGEPKSKRIVDKARREGATDNDIKEWWNLPDLGRRMVLWSEDMLRYSVFLHAQKEDGMSAEDAAARVHTMFPIYGDPEDTSKLHDDNRPLPHELRGRVDSYKRDNSAESIVHRVKSFSSYNAFVRFAVKRGLL